MSQGLGVASSAGLPLPSAGSHTKKEENTVLLGLIQWSQQGSPASWHLLFHCVGKLRRLFLLSTPISLLSLGTNQAREGARAIIEVLPLF